MSYQFGVFPFSLFTQHLFCVYSESGSPNYKRKVQILKCLFVWYLLLIANHFCDRVHGFFRKNVVTGGWNGTIW